MNTDQVCTRFYEGKRTNGKANSVYFDGNTLYSYGTHFPMAVRVGKNLYAWNENRYSNTTSKHQSKAWDPTVLYIPCDTQTMQEWDLVIRYGYETHKAKTDTLSYIHAKIQEAEDKKSRARLDHMKERWQNEIDRYNQARLYLANVK